MCQSMFVLARQICFHSLSTLLLQCFFFVSVATLSDSNCCGLYSMLCHAMLRYAFHVMLCRLMLPNQVLSGVEPFLWHAVLLL